MAVRSSWAIRSAVGLTCALLAVRASPASSAEQDLSAFDLQTPLAMDVTRVSQKLADNVNTVPIAMIILKSDVIEGTHLPPSTDLPLISPGQAMTQSLGRMLPYMRGVGTDLNTTSAETSVAVYVDGSSFGD